MLSILVPLYNYNVRPLISALSKALESNDISYEILCFDDASTIAFEANQRLTDFPNVRYRLLDKNIGRSRIRNRLAAEAQYDWLLFLDADILPKNNHFIAQYLDNLIDGPKVICGGIQYRPEDANDENSLRYLYGSQVEARSAEIRNKHPFKWFSAANVLMAKSVFSSVRFFGELQDYGMEDTLFAVQLSKRGISVKHIENPVWHLGLESNAVYLEKTKKAVENLFFLYQNQLISPADSRLLQTALNLKKWKLSKVFKKLFEIQKEGITKNLLYGKPKLFRYNYYRLGLLNALFSS